MTGSGFGIRVTGLTEIQRRVEAIDQSLGRGLGPTHGRIGQLVAARARPGTPHRTGRLMATVHGSASGRSSVVQAGSASVPYAGPIHYGWPARRIHAQPWVIDAAQGSEGAWVAVYEADLRKLVEQHG